MPRQILPGLHYKQWVPPLEGNPDPKDYVFPELVITDDEIPDDRWNDWAWIEQQPKDVIDRRILRETMSQLLYNSIAWMMNHEANGIDKNNRDQFIKDSLELLLPREGRTTLNLATQAMIYRVAHCDPSGFYVWK